MNNVVDRRKFLTYTGAAGAATGAAWIAPSVLGSSSAFAAGSCVNKAGLDWDAQTVRNIPAPGSSNSFNYDVAIPASGTSPAITLRITVARVGTPGTGGGVYNGLLNQQNGGIPGRQYFVGMSNNASNAGYSVTFSFLNAAKTAPVNVYNLAYTVTDIDSAGSRRPRNGYQDVVQILPVPSSYTKYSANVVQSAIAGGNQFAAVPGSGNVEPSSNSGNVDLTFAGPLNSTTVSFLSGSWWNAIQSISISDLSWCY